MQQPKRRRVIKTSLVRQSVKRWMLKLTLIVDLTKIKLRLIMHKCWYLKKAKTIR